MRKNAGYTIIYAISISKTEEVVLGKNDVTGIFVTWMSNQPLGNYYWGHYFGDELNALEDLIKRARQERA